MAVLEREVRGLDTGLIVPMMNVVHIKWDSITPIYHIGLATKMMALVSDAPLQLTKLATPIESATPFSNLLSSSGQGYNDQTRYPD